MSEDKSLIACSDRTASRHACGAQQAVTQNIFSGLQVENEQPATGSAYRAVGARP